jgi:AcrR family transcriptional regulator
MTGRPRSASDEAIFEAVAAVVTASGPSGLTLAAVGERAGLSAPALAQRFGSKQRLLAAFAARQVIAVTDALASARAGQPDPVSALVTVLVALPGAVTTRDGVANNLAFLQMDLTDPQLRPHAVAHSRALRDGIAALVTDAVQAGLLTTATDPGPLAADLWTAYCGAMVTWAIDGTGTLPGWIAEHLERTLAPHRDLVKFMHQQCDRLPAPAGETVAARLPDFIARRRYDGPAGARRSSRALTRRPGCGCARRW